MSTERTCDALDAVQHGESVDVYGRCGQPLAPDMASPCAVVFSFGGEFTVPCGGLRESGIHTEIGSDSTVHAYVASRMTCSAGHSVVA